MVSGLRASDTAGTSVSQWADTATIAVGRGSCLPSEARKARAGESCKISVGAPCDTNTVGMDIALFLVRLVAACVQSGADAREGAEHACITEIGPARGRIGAWPRPGAGDARHGRDHAQAGGAFRSQGAGSDLDH